MHQEIILPGDAHHSKRGNRPGEDMVISEPSNASFRVNRQVWTSGVVGQSKEQSLLIRSRRFCRCSG